MGRVLFAALVLVLAFYSGCISNGNNAGEKGVLQGYISIGPLCPVERNPPREECLPNEETYRAYPISVYLAANNQQEVARFTADANGFYSIELPAGTYVLRNDSGISTYSETVQIGAGEITTLNIDIDTGIR